MRKYFEEISKTDKELYETISLAATYQSIGRSAVAGTQKGASPTPRERVNNCAEMIAMVAAKLPGFKTSLKKAMKPFESISRAGDTVTESMEKHAYAYRMLQKCLAKAVQDLGKTLQPDSEERVVLIVQAKESLGLDLQPYLKASRRLGPDVSGFGRGRSGRPRLDQEWTEGD